MSNVIPKNVQSGKPFFSRVETYFQQRNTELETHQAYWSYFDPRQSLYEVHRKNLMSDLNSAKIISDNGTLEVKLKFDTDHKPTWFGAEWKFLPRTLKEDTLKLTAYTNTTNANLHLLSFYKNDHKILERIVEKNIPNNVVKYIQAEYIPGNKIVFLTNSQNKTKKSYLQKEIQNSTHLFGQAVRAHHGNWELQPNAFNTLGV